VDLASEKILKYPFFYRLAQTIPSPRGINANPPNERLVRPSSGGVEGSNAFNTVLICI